jgi:diguanylate cyclase (GGDEF)-like protein
VTQLHGLLDIAAALRSSDGVRPMLEAVAETTRRALGYRTIVVNVYRPAWDDFEVVVVLGDEDAREAILGHKTSWETWRPVLDDRFRQGGTYFVPEGSFEWGDDPARFVPELPAPSHEDAWRAGDELFVPLHGGSGEVLGILSLDEPLDGRRPGPDSLRLLEAVAAHTAMAMDMASQAREAARHRAAVEHLLRISVSLVGRRSVEETLGTVCEGIRDALRFRIVASFLFDEPADTFRLVAESGLAPQVATAVQTLPGDLMKPLLDDAKLDREGCVLLDSAAAEARTPPQLHGLYVSKRNGRGPQAWSGHWLQVPLRNADGRLIGVIWVDEPEDRLLPADDQLRTLRAFANQAVTAIESTRDMQRLAHQAEHDALTGLRNRRGLVEEIDAGLARESVTALLLLDLDHFKRINDELGYAAGDEAIRSVARVLDGHRGPEGLAARLGGEEFMLVVPCPTEAAALAHAERIREAVRSSFAEHPWPLTVSVGVATDATAEADANILMRDANAALVLAKGRGRNRCELAGGSDLDAVLAARRPGVEATPDGEALVRLAATCDMRDAGTGRHSQLVARYAEATAARLGLEPTRVEEIRLAGVLHDVGKLGISPDVLHKPEKLTGREWEEIRRHPELGERMLAHAGLERISAWVGAHHERIDGRGYPLGLAGPDIPLEARILAVADAFEAMTNARPYRPTRTLPDALAELRRCAGTQFDDAVVEALAAVVDDDDQTGWVTTIAYSPATSAPAGSNGTRSTCAPLPTASASRLATAPVASNAHQNSTDGPAPEIVAPSAPSSRARSASASDPG